MVVVPPLENKRILVTGANGFIGSHLVRKLVDHGAITSALVSPASTLRHIQDLTSKINIVRCDLLDPPSLNAVVSEIRPQFIFHLATYGVYADQTDRLRMSHVNVFGLTNLLTALDDVDFECFINTGTAIEYGFKKAPMKETDLLEPNNFYGATKAAATLLLQAYAVRYQKKVITLRPFYVYGPGERENRLIRTVIRSALEGTELRLTSLSETRDFVFITDLLDAYLLALSEEVRGSPIINIGTSIETTFKRVIEIIEDLTERRLKINEGAYQPRPWSSHCWAADITKARQLLHWGPTTPVREGISEVLKWHRAQKAAVSLS